MAIFSGTIAYWLWQIGQKTVEVSEAALFDYLTAIFTVIFAVIFLGEAITLPFIIGAVILVIGIFIAETRHKMI
jgi:drug/metabolite transporter (DMT)-like permease